MTVLAASTPRVASGRAPRAQVALAVAAAVDAVGGARRSVGPGVEVATMYRGGRVVGVRLGDQQIEVHVVAARTDVAVLAAELHGAIRRALDHHDDHRLVALIVDDLDLTSGPGEVS